MKAIFGRGKGDALSGKRVTVGSTTVNVQDKIADGGFGQIYRATDSSSKVYALKSLISPDREHREQIQNEYEIQKLASSHPNVVDVYGMSGENPTLILMEFCPDSLVAHMNQCFDRGFSEQVIVEVFQAVCAAVEFMHRSGISHRDLKPENVLLNGGVWKLCDFGSATKMVYDLEKPGQKDMASADIEKNTTPLYRAPEMCDLYCGKKITTKVDVWALGCILFKLCTFRDAFPEGTNLQILNVKYQWPSDRHVDGKFKELVKYCFTVDPDERPTAREVLARLHELFPQNTDAKWAGSGEGSGKRKRNAIPTPQTPQPKRTKKSQNQQEVTGEDEELPGDFSPKMARGRFSSFTSSPTQTVDHRSMVTSGSSGEIANMNRSQPLFSSVAQSPMVMEPQQDPFQAPAMYAPQVDPFQAGAPPMDPFTQVAMGAPQVDPFQAASMGAPQVDPFQTPAVFAPVPTPATEPMLGPAIIEPAVVMKPLVVNSFNLDVERIVSDEEGLVKELLDSDLTCLSTNLSVLSSSKPKEFPVFAMKLLHESGTRVNDIVKLIPKLEDKAFDQVFDSRVAFQAGFPEFEGNFSVNTYAKANPVKPGDTPLSVDAVKKLQMHLGNSIKALVAHPVQEVAAECFFAYQVTAFILAKLKQCKSSEGFVTMTSIPLLKNQHGQIKRALTKLAKQPPFPAEPFNFDDPTFLKRIRSPASKNP